MNPIAKIKIAQIKIAQWIKCENVVLILSRGEDLWTRMFAKTFAMSSSMSVPDIRGTYSAVVSERTDWSPRERELIGEAFLQWVIDASGLKGCINHPEDIKVVSVATRDDKMHILLDYRGDKEYVQIERYPGGWEQKEIDASGFMDAWASEELQKKWRVIMGEFEK